MEWMSGAAAVRRLRIIPALCFSARLLLFLVSFGG